MGCRCRENRAVLNVRKAKDELRELRRIGSNLEARSAKKKKEEVPQSRNAKLARLSNVLGR